MYHWIDFHTDVHLLFQKPIWLVWFQHFFCFFSPVSKKTLANGWNSLQKTGYMKYETWLIMIEAWQHGLALLTAPSAELFAQAYRSPSLSSSSYFSWVAHSPEARMPSLCREKLGKARRQGHKYYTHTSPIHHKRNTQMRLKLIKYHVLLWFMIN